MSHREAPHPDLGAGLHRAWADPAWRPDAARALRCTAAFMAPLLAAPLLHWAPPTAIVAAIAGESLALIEVRGPYSLRLLALSAVAVILAAAAWAGAAGARSVLWAVLAAGIVAALAGLWRHLSSDFGLSLGVSSGVLFLIALAYPPAAAPAWSSGRAALLGGLLGVGTQMAMWPIRAQQPLRRLVCESWLAAAALLSALGTDLTPGAAGQTASFEAERQLRTTLDASAAALGAAEGTKPRPILTQLLALNHAAVQLCTRALALGVALEPMKPRADFDQFSASLQAVLETLEHLARAIARAVVTRRAADLLVCNLRLRRAAHLLEALQARLLAQATDAGERDAVEQIVVQLAALLPTLRQQVAATVDRAHERTALALELPAVTAPSLRPLAAALNLHGRIDPALVRYAARIAVLMMCGVGLYRGFSIPRGYWLPLTLIVVLQPDYGATRTKAARRLLGTLAGLLLASALLLLPLPHPLSLGVIAGAMALFAFWVRRNYALAVFFITLMLGMELHLGGTPTLTFALERLGGTLAGGAIAWVAALLFWPSWERERMPQLLAQSLRANRAYLEQVVRGLAAGAPRSAAAVTAKRAVERANNAVFGSLDRMSGDPQNQQSHLEQAAALANGNQRLTRLLTTIMLGQRPVEAREDLPASELAAAAGQALERIAAMVERGAADPRALDDVLPQLGALRWEAGDAGGLRRVNTEVIALCAAALSELEPEVR